MSWNFRLPALLKPSWTIAVPWPGWVPRSALIADSLRSRPVASGGPEARLGWYVEREEQVPCGAFVLGQPFVAVAVQVITVVLAGAASSVEAFGSSPRSPSVASSVAGGSS